MEGKVLHIMVIIIVEWVDKVSLTERDPEQI